MIKKLIFLIIALLMFGCTDPQKPKGIEPVESFDLNAYLGKWYEIARMNHDFEKGLSNVTATYSPQKGEVKVVNRGYNESKKKWEEAVGEAEFVKSSNSGFLKVTFFWPFYGAYVIIDTDYSNYALIGGDDKSYMWILSRQRQLEPDTMDYLLQKAKSLGYDTDALIYVDQSLVE